MSLGLGFELSKVHAILSYPHSPHLVTVDQKVNTQLLLGHHTRQPAAMFADMMITDSTLSPNKRFYMLSRSSIWNNTSLKAFNHLIMLQLAHKNS